MNAMVSLKLRKCRSFYESLLMTGCRRGRDKGQNFTVRSSRSSYHRIKKYGAAPGRMIDDQNGRANAVVSAFGLVAIARQ